MYWSFSPNYKYATPGFGAQGANGYGSTAMASTLVGLMDGNLAKKQPVVNINLRMQDSGTLFTWNGAYKPCLDPIWNDGRIPFCTWGLWDLGNRANNKSLRLSQIAAGALDSYFIDFFTGAAAWGHPFWVRPWWEFNVRDMWAANGNFPWCVGAMTDTGNTWTNWAPILGGTNPADGSTTSDYVRAWRHVYNLRNQYGATNVQFVWCPNGQSGSTGKTGVAQTGPLSDFWPGASYVDWMGPDLYQAGYGGGSISAAGGTWKSLYEIMTGSSGTGLANTWQNVLNCDESGKIPMCIPEHNANLSVFVTGSDSTGRIGRAAYLKDLYEVSVPALPRLGLLTIFSWYDTGDAYTWEQYDDGSPSLDGVNHSPDGSGNANLNTALGDYAAAARAMGSSFYPDKTQIVLPANLGPIRPHWLEDIPDRHRKAIRSNRSSVGYWRMVEASGNLTDDSGAGHTATAAGSPTYAATTVVPANPTDGSVSFPGDTSTLFSVGDFSTLSAVTTTQLHIEAGFTVAAFPIAVNAHIVAKGNTGQFEYSLYCQPSGTLTWNIWNLTASVGSQVTYGPTLPLNKRLLAQVSFDTTTQQIALTLSAEDGAAWGNLALKAGAGTGGVTPADSTSAFVIGRRADATTGHNGHIGHVHVSSVIPPDVAQQENYRTWLAAPVITAVNIV